MFALNPREILISHHIDASSQTSFYFQEQGTGDSPLYGEHTRIDWEHNISYKVRFSV